MKYCLEFGNRGGAHVDNLVIGTRKAAEAAARSLVMVFENDPHARGAHPTDWLFSRGVVRLTWQSPTHFVAISKLDGIPRGPSAAGLWRQPGEASLLDGSVIPHYGAKA